LMPTLDRIAQGQARTIAGFVIALSILVYLVVLGSRAGLVLAGVGLVGALMVKPRFDELRPKSWKQWAIAGAIAVLLIVVVIAVVLADRSASVDRIAAMHSLDGEGRLTKLPIMLQILGDVWPFGTGYGSFVPVFQSYEPDSMLSPFYWNNAHNDPLEVLITGGIPGGIAICAFLAWWVRASYRAFSINSDGRSSTLLARAAAFATLILLLASLVDYPLRTPLLGAVFAVLCCWLIPTKRSRSDPD
jgi:O-antigen ligase